MWSCGSFSGATHGRGNCAPRWVVMIALEGDPWVNATSAFAFIGREPGSPSVVNLKREEATRMKLVITIDVPDYSAQLAPAIEDRVEACVHHYSDIVHGGLRVSRVRLLPDRLDDEHEDGD